VVKDYRIDEIPNFDNLEHDKINPLEPVVKKIEERGFTIDQCFTLLDDNGDEILTMQEIQTGFPKLKIILENAEMAELLKQMDANHDGVLTMEEFVTTL
jgi:Ca2+-binding EF-hand superfamily protein